MADATYHRVESPTQTAADALTQQKTSELWGFPARGSDIPKVKAYTGPLPPGVRGIEFTTTVEPDTSCPPGYAYWSGPRAGVIVDGNRAKIHVEIVRNAQV